MDRRTALGWQTFLSALNTLLPVAGGIYQMVDQGITKSKANTAYEGWNKARQASPKFVPTGFKTPGGNPEQIALPGDATRPDRTSMEDLRNRLAAAGVADSPYAATLLSGVEKTVSLDEAVKKQQAEDAAKRAEQKRKDQEFDLKVREFAARELKDVAGPREIRPGAVDFATKNLRTTGSVGDVSPFLGERPEKWTSGTPIQTADGRIFGVMSSPEGTMRGVPIEGVPEEKMFHLNAPKSPGGGGAPAGAPSEKDIAQAKANYQRALDNYTSLDARVRELKDQAKNGKSPTARRMAQAQLQGIRGQSPVEDLRRAQSDLSGAKTYLETLTKQK